MKDYQILTAPSACQLVGYVKDAMKKGWEPVGGVAVTQLDYQIDTFCQAMTKQIVPGEVP